MIAKNGAMYMAFLLTLVFSDKEFRPKFNGKDLSGWHALGDAIAKEAWSVKDDVIVCSGKGGGYAWLCSDEEYDDFVLRVEFKVSPKCNSGIFLRANEKGRASRTGMEFQILDDPGKPPDKGSTGSIYDCVAPSKNMSKPTGEWNQVEITCYKSHVVFVLNGEKIIDVNLDDDKLNSSLDEDHKLFKRQRKGHIGLQNHGKAVEFRNIQIKRL